MEELYDTDYVHADGLDNLIAKRSFGMRIGMKRNISVHGNGILFVHYETLHSDRVLLELSTALYALEKRRRFSL